VIILIIVQNINVQITHFTIHLQIIVQTFVHKVTILTLLQVCAILVSLDVRHAQIILLAIHVYLKITLKLVVHAFQAVMEYSIAKFAINVFLLNKII